ncbi:MAG: hypothetical protein K2Q24_13390 [Chitinophagaceae bacterium]|nr:hypothetical protein [Chitinophagaceae bacterium]
MKAKIYSHKQLIATTDLQVGDFGMGCVYGIIIPTDFYFDEIQRRVWDFWSTNKPNYEKWYSLRLNVQLENGYFLYSAGGYTIDDIPDLPNEPKRIDIAGVDMHIIEDYFLQEIPRTFIEDPWEEINIGMKIGFEDELKKEIGVSVKSVFNFFKSQGKKHELAEFEFSALCKYRCNDDVLFVARKEGFDMKFAVIHLTWKGSKEEKGFPGVDFYNDFEDFKRLRMNPDVLEWKLDNE